MLYDNYIIHKVFEEDDILFLKNKIFSDEIKWISGLKTLVGSSSNDLKKTIKHNLELDNAELKKELTDFTVNRIMSDFIYTNYTVPFIHSGVIISKMNQNGFYDVHIDSHNVGEYSTTIFINSPDSYEGGELCLLIENKEHKFKLKSGYAITYKTGILHKVSEVLKGERLVFVLWTKSLFKDLHTRNIYSNLKILRKFFKKNNLTKYESLENIKNEPSIILDNILREMQVHFAREKK